MSERCPVLLVRMKFRKEFDAQSGGMLMQCGGFGNDVPAIIPYNYSLPLVNFDFVFQEYMSMHL